MASFVDTNVLVYAYDQGDVHKRSIAVKILEDDTLDLVVSAQVLDEFYWVVTRKLNRPLAEEVAHEVVRLLSQGDVVAIDATLVDAAITMARQHRLSLWDAAIVAAARRADCGELLTEDLAHGSTIAGITIRNPFLG